MRGSSDLESVWETRLTFKRDGDSGAVTVRSEHRDEDDGATIVYRLDWDGATRTMRLRPTLLPLAERILEHLAEHGPMGAADLAKGVDTRRSDVDRVLLELQKAGTTRRGSSGKPDALGRSASNKVWHLSKQAGLLDTTDRPDTRTTRDDPPDTGAVRHGSSPPYKGDVPDDPSDGLSGRANGTPTIGDDGYLEHLLAALTNGHVTEGEWHQGSKAHAELLARHEAGAA
jgi:hypothetical protein